MRGILLTGCCLMMVLLSGCKQTNDPFETAVRASVERQMRQYPASTLKDLYKNFFQDKYGPGHIVSDTTAAGNYLRRELDAYTEVEGERIEPLGWEGNYLRVNLSVIKEGKIPYPVFFDAFVRSVNGIQPMPVADWTTEWNRIEAIIASMALPLPDYAADKAAISQRLAEGDYVGHHSQAFEAAYKPHYRIISREIYEQELKQYIN